MNSIKKLFQMRISLTYIFAWIWNLKIAEVFLCLRIVVFTPVECPLRDSGMSARATVGWPPRDQGQVRPRDRGIAAARPGPSPPARHKKRSLLREADCEL